MLWLQSTAKTTDEYIKSLQKEKAGVISDMRKLMFKNIPIGIT